MLPRREKLRPTGPCVGCRIRSIKFQVQHCSLLRRHLRQLIPRLQPNTVYTACPSVLFDVIALRCQPPLYVLQFLLRRLISNLSGFDVFFPRQSCQSL